MMKSHRCAALAFDVSCIISAYLDIFINDYATPSPSHPGGRTPAPFQFIIDDLEHGHYLGLKLPPSLS